MHIDIQTRYSDTAVRPFINPHTKMYDGHLWQTLVRLTIHVDGVIISIAPGFVSNLGSVPKLGRCLVDTNDETLWGYLFHDYCYAKNGHPCTRAFADKLLLMMALHCGQDKPEAYLAYLGVRIGGSKKFKQKKAHFLPIDHELIDKICDDNNYYPTP